MKKPPRVRWQPTVPSWEKKFCKFVGAMDWETFLDKKKFVHLYENIIKWNDSAGEEAFHNAKQCFFAQMHGWPCNISLPSPDLYIDEVDWDRQDDLKSSLDLEHEPLVPSDPDIHEPVVIFGDAAIRGLGFSPAGWGDEDKNFRKAANSSSNNSWEQRVCQSKENTLENVYVESDYNARPSHEIGGGLNDTGWGDCWEDMKATQGSSIPGVWQVNNWENDKADQYETSYNSSRFVNNNSNYYKRKHRWRNGSGQKRETTVG